MDAQLIRYDEMCRAIDAAYDVDEVADIRDKTLAIELYMRQQRNTEAERRACEIRLRAERKLGKLLRDVDRTQGQRTDREISSRIATKSFRDHLEEHGISKDQAYCWQQLAAVPDAQFESALAAPEKPSRSGIIGPRLKVDPMDPRALWLWGRLRDFEREELLSAEPMELFEKMTEAMQADVRRLVPLVVGWLEELTHHDD